MSYFPLDRDILTSSLWVQGTPGQIKVWFYLMLTADPRTGVVNATDPAIAAACVLTLEETVRALEWLASPDEFSRTQEHEGRRIQRLPGGRILLLTYGSHRDKDYSTGRVREWRDRKRSETIGNGGKRETPSETTDTDTDLTLKISSNSSDDLDPKDLSASTKPPKRIVSRRFWWDAEKKRVWGTDGARAELKAKWLSRGLTAKEFQVQMGVVDRWLEDHEDKRRSNANFANRINNFLNTYLARQEEKALL